MIKNHPRLIITTALFLFLSLSLTTSAMTNREENIRTLLIALVGRLEQLQAIITSTSVASSENLSGTLTTFVIDPIDGSNSRTEQGLQDDTGRQYSLQTPQPLAIRSGTKINIKKYQYNANTNSVIIGNPATDIETIGPQTTSTVFPDTMGVLPTAVILVDFLDSGPRPFTQEQITPVVFSGQFQNFYREQSYDQTSIAGIVTDWQRVNRNGVVNGSCRWPGYQNNAELSSLISNSGVDLNTHRRLIILANHPCLSGGLSTIGLTNFTINGQVYHNVSLSYIGSLDIWNQPSNRGVQPFSWTNLDRLLSHEFGHSLGLQHSNGWDCGDQVFIGTCQHIEYGNGFDNMGGLVNGGYTLHWNGYQKELLGWLPPETILTIATSGRYTIAPLETLGGSGQIKTAKILLPPDPNNPNTQNRSLYLEYRRGIGFDANLNKPWLLSNQTGLMANLQIKNNAGWNVQLLDLSPTTATWLSDLTQATLNAPASKDDLRALSAIVSSLSAKVISNQIPGVTLGPVISAGPSGVTFDIGLNF